MKELKDTRILLTFKATVRSDTTRPIFLRILLELRWGYNGVLGQLAFWSLPHDHSSPFYSPRKACYSVDWVSNRRRAR